MINKLTRTANSPMRSYRATTIPKGVYSDEVEVRSDQGLLPTIQVLAINAGKAMLAAHQLTGRPIFNKTEVEMQFPTPSPASAGAGSEPAAPSSQRRQNPLDQSLWPAAIFTVGCANRCVECRHGQRAYAGGAACLGLGHQRSQLGIRHHHGLGLKGQPAALGLQVLLGLDAGLHQQGQRSAHSQRHAGSHHQAGRVIHRGQRRTRAAHQLHKVKHNVHAPVQALAGQVKPVAVVDVKSQVCIHAFVLEVWATAQAPGQAEKVAPGFDAQYFPFEVSWATRKSEGECVDTLTVALDGLPAHQLTGLPVSKVERIEVVA